MSEEHGEKLKIVVGIPCYNEELTIAKVISDFRRELPHADILVMDNNSRDKTADIARQSGAQVLTEKRQGKGCAVRKIFDEFRGEILILVDGDDTYLASDVHKLLTPVINGEADMMVGNRIHRKNSAAFSGSHWLGNKFLTKALNFVFKTKLKDMQSGFRVIHRRLVDASALLIDGFAIEPEMTIQALERGLRIKELPISLINRKEGSYSKINTVRDGTIALYTIISLFRDYRPLHFFAWLSFFSILIALGLGWYSIRDYFTSGLVRHVPSLVVAGFFAISSLINFIAGLILSSIKRRHEELLVAIRKKNLE